MGLWLRRVCALGLISLGMALLCLPFNDTRSGYVEEESVSLQKAQLLSPDEIGTRFPGAEITDITGPALNPDDYPGLWRVFMNLDTDWTHDSSDLHEWNRFQDTVLQGISPSRLVVFREGLVHAAVGRDKGNDAPEAALFSYLGRYNPHIKKLSESDLADFPAITRSLSPSPAGDTGTIAPASIPKDEWNRMVDRYLDPLVDSQTFNFKGTFYEPVFGWDVIRKEGRISGLSTILKLLGVIALVIGVLLLRRLYFRKGGIMINPPGIALLYDGITLLFAVPAAYMTVNTILAKTMHITPIIDEDFILFMGTFFFCAGIPLVTFYTSRFTSQSVVIDSSGIHVDSLVEKDTMPWDSLDSMDFSDEYVLVSRVGIPVPRQLQKSLRLTGTRGQHVIINEPQLKSVKHRIAMQFEAHAPDHLKEGITRLLDRW